MEGEKKSASELRDSVWASSAIFCLASGVLFLMSEFKDGPQTGELAWFAYLAGWVPLILMTLWCLVARKKPPIPAAPIGLGIAIFFGLFISLLNHENWPL